MTSLAPQAQQTRWSTPSGVGFLALWMIAVLSTLLAQFWRTSENFSISEVILVFSFGALVLTRTLNPRAPRLSLPGLRLVAGFVAFWVVLHLAWAIPNGAGELSAAKDLASFLFLIVGLWLLSRVRPALLLPAVTWFLPGVSVLLWVLLVSDGNLRSRGLFGDPNLAGSLAATLVIGMLALATRRTWLPSTVGALLATHALILTNSMSAFSAIIPAVTYLALGRFQPVVRAIGVVASAVVAVYASQWLGGLISSERFEFSRDARFEIWTETLRVWFAHPLGIGADSLRLPGIGITWVVDTHNDFLHSLVAFGPIGLIVLVGIFVSLARLGGNRTVAMVIFLAVTSMTINALNFRNYWLILALIITVDNFAIAYSRSEAHDDEART